MFFRLDCLFKNILLRDRSALSRMKGIMKTTFKSRRHDLFLVRKEREQCNGMKMSTLHRLSNPSFLGGNFEQDSNIINLITQNVFKVSVVNLFKKQIQ